MIKTLLADGPAFGFMLSAASLATASARRLRPFSASRTRTAAGGTAPTWLPWAIVATLAAASIAFGILSPDAFTAAMNEGFTAP
jgi:hypothetical protein